MGLNFNPKGLSPGSKYFPGTYLVVSTFESQLTFTEALQVLALGFPGLEFCFRYQGEGDCKTINKNSSVSREKEAGNQKDFSRLSRLPLLP